MSSNQSPNFDSIKQTNVYGVDYWSGRALMLLLGYGKKWQNFESVIQKAMIACAETHNIVEDHFTAVSKMVQTEAKLHRDPVSSLDEASQAHYFIGDQVRKAIEAMHAPMPEDLPPAASIRKMVEDRRKAAKKRTVKASEQAQGQEILLPAQDQIQDN